MSPLAHDLPQGVYEWIEQVGRGTISRLVRHVARREAWIVDVTRADGSILEGFLRLQREDGGVDPRRLEREIYDVTQEIFGFARLTTLHYRTKQHVHNYNEPRQAGLARGDDS